MARERRSRGVGAALRAALVEYGVRSTEYRVQSEGTGGLEYGWLGGRERQVQKCKGANRPADGAKVKS